MSHLLNVVTCAVSRTTQTIFHKTTQTIFHKTTQTIFRKPPMCPKPPTATHHHPLLNHPPPPTAQPPKSAFGLHLLNCRRVHFCKPPSGTNAAVGRAQAALISRSNLQNTKVRVGGLQTVAGGAGGRSRLVGLGKRQSAANDAARGRRSHTDANTARSLASRAARQRSPACVFHVLGVRLREEGPLEVIW